ncbi:hypothetical protein [Christiangramia sabulilitoris]|uniref:Secreted protein n=1 Tax=Christiangramia sabulilitoris TaxID=2583991 RepID=A0A550HZF8_9FLAO|nr:hypothetical protein [Christiangramia sabulilitoris]TRO64080.1 hypothetical protein FGM01_11270 [Christiangramia sabulilitoris]
MYKFTFKLFMAMLFLFNLNTAMAQTNLYQHPQFDQLTAGHKIIAIVPFEASVNLRPKQMKDMTPEQLAKLEESEGLSIQAAMYSWFLKRKKRGDLKVDVQDPKRTNALLHQADFTDLNLHTPEEIAAILGVDAVISGTFETDKPMSEGASIALGLLIGFWGSTNTAVINMSVNNAESGELLWNYNKKVRGSLGSDNDTLINTLMRKASRRLGYTD